MKNELTVVDAGAVAPHGAAVCGASAAEELAALRLELEHLRAENQALAVYRDLAYQDHLTGLRNRRYFEERLAQELSRSGRVGNRVSVLLIDLDDFKCINDRAGHATGDAVLTFLGSFLAQSCRTTDIPCRLGGDEFAIILPDTDAQGAAALARRLRDQLPHAEGRPLLPKGLGVHLSMGWAEGSDRPGGAGHVVAAADEAMYRHKRARKRTTKPAVIAAA